MRHRAEGKARRHLSCRARCGANKQPRAKVTNSACTEKSDPAQVHLQTGTACTCVPVARDAEMHYDGG